jgi:putative membrane protein
MLIEIISFLLLGILAGTFTGLFPGIHINLIGAALVSLSVGILSSLNPVYLCVFIVSMAITHTFLDFIPSVFLGCPDTDTPLSILPGHEMLKNGRAYEAVLLTAYGGLMAISTLSLISLPLVFLIPKVYAFLKKDYIMAGVLILVSIILIFSEKNKFRAFSAFMLAGVLGLCSLNLDVNQPLLPLLSGLFGASSLVLSIKNKTLIPKQEINCPKLKEMKKPLAKAFLGSLIASPLCSFLPGLGSGEAAVIGSQISGNEKRGFLILLGATNTLVMGLSFVFLYTISKARTGASAAVEEILMNFSWRLLLLFIVVILISGIISFFLAKTLAGFFSRKIGKINYTKISVITLIILSAVILTVSGILGMIIFVISAFTGIYCISLKVRRTLMMGCLLLSTILIYLNMKIF